MTRLRNKIAVVYGTGAVGRAVSLAFAKEGAFVHLAGRDLQKLDAIAQEAGSFGNNIETALVDAMNENSVETHINDVIKKSGSIDISFNAIGITQTGHQGTSLTALTLKNFLHPIMVYSQAHFITAKAAAKRMIEQKRGVIVMNTPSPSRISVPFMGGMPSAWSSIEALSRTISAECGPQGVRSVCILTSAMPDTPLIDEVYSLHAKAHNIELKQFQADMEGKTHLKRLASIQDLANAAIFVASDEGKSMTGTILNLTAGLVID